MSPDSMPRQHIDTPSPKPCSIAADFQGALEDPKHPYHAVAEALLGAYAQAAFGKGRERHANDLPFTEQKMLTICRALGSTQGMTYQVCKKAQEAERLGPKAKIHEMQGVIVYATGIIAYENEQLAIVEKIYGPRPQKASE